MDVVCDHVVDAQLAALEQMDDQPERALTREWELLARLDADRAAVRADQGDRTAVQIPVEIDLAGDAAWTSIFAIAIFLALAWGVFLGLYRMARQWENEVGE